MALPFFKLMAKNPKFFYKINLDNDFKIIISNLSKKLSVDDFCEFSNGLCVMYEVFLQNYKLLHDTLKIKNINQEPDKLEISLNCKYPVEFLFYLNSRIQDFNIDINMQKQLKALAGILKPINQ